MKYCGRMVAVILVTATAVSILQPGRASASPDDMQTTTDDRGRTLTIEQWGTFLDSVSPLDRNRLTREWFHSGKAAYTVDGPDADAFTGTLQLGYQVSFPWTLGVTLNFSYATPNVGIWAWGERLDPLDGFDDIYTTPFFPGGQISVDLREGPGMQEVATFAGPAAGRAGKISVSNAHGTVTGVAGGVVLRPYARLISNDGHEVTTYGELWNMS